MPPHLPTVRLRQTVLRTFNRRSHGITNGYRSGLEDTNAAHLKSHGVTFRYEAFSIPFRVEQDCKYTPDFELPNGIIIETKGLFTSDDRVKHMRVKAQYPLLDLRFVFSNSLAKLSKTSKTTYAAWCDKHGFQCASKLIPISWIKEKKKAHTWQNQKN